MIPLEQTPNQSIDGYGRFAHPEFNRAFFVMAERQRYRDWGKEKGPKVGDLYLEPGDDPKEPFRRFTYDMGDTIQGSDRAMGSFHVDEMTGSMTYSGTLTGPMPKSEFHYVGVAKASCWIFDSSWPRAHAGVVHHIYVRVWQRTIP